MTSSVVINVIILILKVFKGSYIVFLVHFPLIHRDLTYGNKIC